MSNNLEAVVWKHEYGFDEAITRNNDGTVTVARSGWQGQELTDEQIATAVSEYALYKAVMDEIERLETVPRRIRENLIALGTEDQVVIDEDAAIAVEREKL